MCLGQLANLIVGKRIARTEDLMQPDVFGVGVMTFFAGHSKNVMTPTPATSDPLAEAIEYDEGEATFRARLRSSRRGTQTS